jgi:hypothetical protein
MTCQIPKLQAKLLGHFGDRTTIQPQRGQGMSNIMFSSCLTIGDAIAAAGKLKSMLRLTEGYVIVSSGKLARTLTRSMSTPRVFGLLWFIILV